MSSNLPKAPWGSLVVLVLGGGLSWAADGNQMPTVDFERDIRPIFADRCQACHGPKKQQASLRLDIKFAALRGGDSGPVIQPGKSTASLLYQRIVSPDAQVRMPSKGQPLATSQIDLVRRWIDQGPWPETGGGAVGDHWSFRAVRDPMPPNLIDKSWLANPIDAFILAKLRASGLRPSPPADRVTLIRRLYLDLLGLPPTLSEVQCFVTDRPNGAYERLVDRVLASPHYGERWARHWLDLAQFAETHGFERNLERPTAWPYRDYVINALNEDKPYDRFLLEQLAGDAVGVDAATGFLVAGPFDDVKSLEEKFRMIQRQDELADMINVTGTAFLGLTLGCARCHNHKFDPISQKDYYSLQAILAGVQHGERPVAGQTEAARKARLAAVQEKISALGKQLEPYRLHLREPVNPEKNTDEFAPVPARFVRFTILATNDGAEPALDELEVWSAGASEADAMRMFARKAFHAPADVQSATLTATCDDHCIIWINGRQVAASDNWQAPIRVDARPMVRAGRNVIAVACRDDLKPAGLVARLVMQRADRSNQVLVTDPSWRQTTAVPAGWEHPDFDDRAWLPAVSFGKLGVPPWGQVFPAVKEGPVPEWIWTDSARNLALACAGATVTASGSLTDNPLRHQIEHLNDGRYGDAAGWVSNLPARGWVQVALPEPASIRRIVWGRDRTKNYDDRLPTEYRIEAALVPGQWHTVASSADRLPFGADQIERLRYRSADLPAGERQQVEAWLSDLASWHARIEDLAAMPAALYAGRFEQPGNIHRLARGDPQQPREVVGPETVAALGTLALPAGTSEQSRRLALARWIIRPENPLTARVMVNRLWQHHFGTGIVDTPSDFGTQGGRPTHPELLDWLATRFIRSGWSIKHLHRLIVTSNSYRQASHPQEQAMRVDAGTRLLWRHPPRRLEAEPIRDSILAISGVLDAKMGGPGFSPFKPTQHHVRVYLPKEREGPADWRRMVYMTKVRMEHDAVFGAFDDPDAGLVCPKRSRSTTAIQAFNLLNSDFMIQQSSLFARRLQREAGEQPEAQVRWAFRLSLGREPDDLEAGAGRHLVRQHSLAALCLALFNSNEFLFVP